MGGQTIYNLNVGTYDLSVSVGPSYNTKRVEAVDAMTQVMQGNPQVMQVAGDIFFRNMDWHGAEEIADRMKLMLPPQLQQQDDQVPPQIQQAMMQVQQAQQELQQQQQQMGQMAQQLEQEKAASEAEKAKLEAAKSELDSQTKILMSRYQELSAKLELQAMKAMQAVPPQMPQGENEPAISPYPNIDNQGMPYDNA